ncbi:MAG: F0F1 ATP synthase subunit B [Acidimicrobiia bacterium]|jgi:F-type H+-transporting ATPase subunit b
MILAQTLLIAAEESEESGGLDILLPPLNELIAGIIAFAIVFFFIWRFAGPGINRMLEQRQAAISGQIEDAEKAKTEAESLLADYRGQLNEAKADANKIIEQAREQAEQMRVDIVAKAESEADQIRAKAREEAAGEKARALAEAKIQVGDISVDLASKIVGESLDENAHRALIDRYLADLEKL